MMIDSAAISIDTILHALEIIVIIGGGFGVAFRLGRTHTAITAAIDKQEASAARQASDIADLKIDIRKLGDILTALAVQENRLDMHEKWIDELRQGEGFKLPLRGAYEVSRK